MLLVHPPIAKPCEPPASISKLAGALSHHNVRFRAWDACIESYYYLLNLPQERFDTFTNRAYHHRTKNIDLFKSWSAYHNVERYKQTLKSIDRVLLMAGQEKGIRVSFANYIDDNLSPLRSSDLIKTAEYPETNIFYPFFKDRLHTLFEEEVPGIVGISLNYLNQALSSFAIIGLIRRMCPDIRIVLGGGLVTSWLQRPDWENPFEHWVDDFVSGPGESRLLEIADVQIGKRFFTPDFRSLPLDTYFSPGRILPYSASSGCYYGKCDFCPEKAERNGYCPIPTDTVVSDLIEMKNNYSPALIHLLDNSVSPKLMSAIIDMSLDTPWYGFVRFTRHFTDEGFCRELKRSGCVMLQLGLESGSQVVLDNMNKGLDLEMAASALKTLKKAGIATYVYLLFGTPGETVKEARETMDFISRHSEYIDFLNLAIFNLPAFSPDAEILDTGKFYDGDLSLYVDFKHPKNWDRYKVRKFLDKEFRKQPGIFSIIKRDPPVFNSNHAPFFVGDNYSV